ncbi:hypothetical protein CYMTET_41305 [Cymbomonas tetramitiformis]|uniref:Uncharacterized protein n=1 Tax=Cymbomonas tetramitiformis TaxID=36881 RepID=A0AAE0C7R6_9CHLO|nr:hypothetical protein CYMTET_41305 [Cymbomonas tetramitiformis]
MSEQVDLTEEEPEGDEAEGEQPPFEFSIVDTLARLEREWNAMSDALVEHEPDGDENGLGEFEAPDEGTEAQGVGKGSPQEDPMLDEDEEAEVCLDTIKCVPCDLH